MKRHIGRLLGLVTASWLVAGFGCDAAPPRAEPPPPKVTVAQAVVQELVDYDQYNGWLDATATVDIRSRVRGHVDKVHFTDGQLVEAGQLLFELDPRPFEAEVSRAQDQLRIYQAQTNRALKEEVRVKDMHSKDVASEMELEIAIADARSLEAQSDAQAQEIVRKQLDLSYSKVTAPIAGRIGQALLTPGNLVNAGGSDPIMASIVSVDPIHVYFHVDERSLQRYQKARNREQPAGTIAELKIPMAFGLETDTGYPHPGMLDFADNEVDATTGTVLMRAVVPNPAGRLLPGYRVHVQVPVSEPRQVQLVPDTAILSDQDKKYLLVLDEKNVVQRRDVQPDKLLDDGMRILLAATGDQPVLGPNERFIVQGLQAARINYAVEPVQPATAPAASAAPAAAPAAAH
jgi:RND family efflux transporter MFP subunit